ncbi:MAG TPA: hypothetical protein VFK89_05995, partial [Actinomycetota bacterium]|nr:hypothetical protein [Actinomycetota bacterium]
MYKISRFSAAIRTPVLWANRKYLRVERRFDGRVSQPRCFVFTDPSGQVIPTVYMMPDRHGEAVPRPEDAFRKMSYKDVDDLVDDGWRPFSEDEIDVGFA